MTESTASRIYVEVMSRCDVNGGMHPLAIYDRNGHCYPIQKVTDTRLLSSMKSGGFGDRYTVWINNRMHYLWFERNGSVAGPNIGRWYLLREKH